VKVRPGSRFVGSKRSSVRPNRNLYLATIAIAVVVVTSGCARPAPSISRKSVITSVTPLGSIARNIVGNRFDIVSVVSSRQVTTGRIPPPSRLEIEALESNAAAAIFMGGFDSAIAEAISTTASDEIETRLISEASPTVASTGEFPWVDPIAALGVAAEIRNFASSLAPTEKSHFDRNLREFTVALTNVQEVVSQTASSVPPGRRKVAATSETMRPFFERYGFRYFSVISEGGSKALADTMKREGITVLYVNGFGSETGRDLASELIGSGVGAFQGELFDALLPGPAGSLYHTYFGLVIENARQAFGPLGADLARLEELRPADVAP
jgi:ABC-type Zn uptake system ZnuABC Zn-binding protein ZnuA